jgi:hypothetical protein
MIIATITISKRKSAQHGWPPQRGKKEKVKWKNEQLAINNEQ